MRSKTSTRSVRVGKSAAQAAPASKQTTRESAARAEIGLLIGKILEKTAKSPEKTAKILSLWVAQPSKSKAYKKAA